MNSVARNTTFLTISFILQKILAFVYFTLIARITGVSFTGSYVFALSFTAMFSVFVDFGLSPLLVREVSRDKRKAALYLNSIISLKIILGILTFLLIFLLSFWIEHDYMTRIMIYLAGLLMLTDSFTLTFWAIFRGFQNLKFEAIAIIISQLITFLIGIGGLLLGFPLYILVLALLSGSLFNLSFSVFLVIRKLNIIPKIKIDYSIIKKLFLIGFPFALLHVFTRLIFSVDIVLLRKLTNSSYVGWYSVAHKITFAFQFLPSAMAASLFPAMSNAFVNNKQRLSMLFERSLKYLILIGMPISMGTTIIAPEFIKYIYTDKYNPSILTLQIIVWSSFFLFISFPVGALLNATNYHLQNAINLGVSVLMMVILNLILIPYLKHFGSAIASVFSWGTLLILNFWHSRKIIPFRHKEFWLDFFKILLSTFFMALVLWYLKYFLGMSKGIINSLIIIPIIGSLIYFVCVFAFGVLTIDELKYIKRRII